MVRSISVNADAQLDAKPDLALVNINLEEQAKKLVDAKAATNKQLRALEAVAKQMGIAPAKIQTTSSSTQPQYRYEPNNKRVFEGYIVSHRIQLQVEKIEIIGELLEKLTSAGIDQIDNVSYTVKDDQAVKEQALIKATQNARRKAEKMVAAAGSSIGKVITISESGASFQPIMAMRAKAAPMMADAAMESAPELPAGGVSVSANVNVTFELK